MVGPVQDVVLGGAVQALEHVLGGAGEVEGLEAEVLQAGMDALEPRDDGVAAQVVVRVAEDLDVGVQGLERVLGVLRGGQSVVLGIGVREAQNSDSS